jgi:hypothetical protein
MDTLTAQVKMAPSLYAAEAAFSPKMQRLALGGYRNSLLGRVTYEQLSDASKTEYNSAMEEYKGATAKIQELTAQRAQVAAGTWSGSDNRAIAGAGGLLGFGHGKTHTVDTASLEQIDTEINRLKLLAITPPDPAGYSDRGLQQILEEDIMPAMSRADIASQNYQRENDIASVERLGARASEAYLNADPRSKGLLEQLNAQASEQLAAAGRGELTPAQLRLAQQTARYGTTARGTTLGNQGLAAEVLGTYEMSEKRRLAAMTNAQAVLGINKGFTADPFQAVLGRASGAFAAGIGQQQFASGFARNTGPTTFSPESQYAADMQNSNQSTAASYAAARAQVTSGIYGAIGSAAGGMMGGGIGNTVNNFKTG